MFPLYAEPCKKLGTLEGGDQSLQLRVQQATSLAAQPWRCPWYRGRASSPHHSDKSLHQTIKALQPPCLHFLKNIRFASPPWQIFYTQSFSRYRSVPAFPPPGRCSSAQHMTGGHSLGFSPQMKPGCTPYFMLSWSVYAFYDQGCGLWWVSRVWQSPGSPTCKRRMGRQWKFLPQGEHAPTHIPCACQSQPQLAAVTTLKCLPSGC